MSRRSRKLLAQSASHASATPLDPKQSVLITGLPSGSGFDAANWSSRRGYVYFPQLNTAREITPWSRIEMLRRARYLTRNVGYAKRCTKGAANMVGALNPRLFSTDKDWDRDALSLFKRRAGNSLTFDRSNRFNVFSYQPMVTQTRLTDGDLGTVLTEGQGGGAMVATYEGHQIGNGLAMSGVEVGDLDQWRDGCYVQNDRAIVYRLLDPLDYSVVTDVPASSFILHADYLSFGHRRGVTALHHAINNMLDITEIRSDVKLGIKLGNRIGYYIARQALTGTQAPKGMGNPPGLQHTESGEPVLVENVWRGGKIMTLNPGEEIKQLLDKRPHPNSREFLEDLNRDIAWGIGLAPDVLWNIAKLGGASVRYVLADAQVWIESQQQLLVDQFLTKYFIYFISKEVAAGRLRPCRDLEWFYKIGWQAPAKMTVDIGRDGKLGISLHQAAMLTLNRWYGAQGLDAEQEVYEYVREYAMKMKAVADVSKETGIQLDFDKVFPAAPGAAGSSSNGNGGSGNSGGDDDAFGADAVQRLLVDVREQLVHLREAA